MILLQTRTRGMAIDRELLEVPHREKSAPPNEIIAFVFLQTKICRLDRPIAARLVPDVRSMAFLSHNRNEAPAYINTNKGRGIWQKSKVQEKLTTHRVN
jgi:hypothetical protein